MALVPVTQAFSPFVVHLYGGTSVQRSCRWLLDSERQVFGEKGKKARKITSIFLKLGAVRLQAQLQD
ncbi:hypothetical protein Mic7113_2202 [Allocoleopsis franciscana PCC 7113]|uniref:Uncharacterized protein n=1 Tax=Allocoleopsis franciscana PCC 7113 TaxID=1173027 RepID=K9WDY7_9CYAN|nr:hypothetical protein Mic7113_2202 [Allocoleopsis franciscana PCC 7113]